MNVSEALLEMHFHSAFVKLFSNVFGKNHLRILKPSPQNERWVGFDQGWVRSELTMQEVFNSLRNSISSNSTSSRLYLGYFFQFKTVKRMVRSSSNKPISFHTPYYRSSISLKPNTTTLLSQHETLRRLSSISNLKTYYACPVLINAEEIYEEPDLNKVMFVDVRTAPSTYLNNEKHYISFQDINTTPYWCSDPVAGEFANIDQLTESLRLLTANEILDIIEQSIDILGIDNLPNSLTIIEFFNDEERET